MDPFHDDPLYGQPWQSPQAREAKRRLRHRSWLAALSARDWRRIEAMADQLSEHYQPPRLDDLDAKTIAVGVCRVGQERWVSGERIGTLRDGQIVVLVWAKR